MCEFGTFLFRIDLHDDVTLKVLSTLVSQFDFLVIHYLLMSPLVVEEKAAPDSMPRGSAPQKKIAACSPENAVIKLLLKIIN